ncbi:hypothetical protein [Roseinatronobacter sp. NSM]|uniref:hypothetical protein n=1 Tax=Roseinatronobacter sp. NSM TaxID=3457785 RepID=UPI004035909C
MGWKAHQSTWPNGRKFWTVEDRQNNKARVGAKGGITKFHDRAQAKAEVDRLNGKDAVEENPLIEQ